MNLPTRHGQFAALLVCVTAFGCSASNASESDFFATVRARSEAVSRTQPIYRELHEAMPNVPFSVDGGAEIYVAEAYVRGKVTDVEIGLGQRWTFDNDVETRHLLEPTDPTAMVVTAHLIVGVEHSIVAPDSLRSIESSIRVGIVLPPAATIDDVRKQLTSLRGVVLLLKDSPSAFDYDPEVWGVLEDGAFFGVVNGNGTASFPAVADANDGQLTVKLSRLEAGSKPIKVRSRADGSGFDRVP